MALETKAVLIMGLATVSLVSVASASHGAATFYTEYVPSACYGFQDQGTMIAAASNAIWNNGAICGKMYKIRCTGATNQGGQPCRSGTVTVKIVDRCPSLGCQATIDLSREAFSAIANPDAGKVNIEYDIYNNGTIYQSSDNNLICLSNSL